MENVRRDIKGDIPSQHDKELLVNPKCVIAFHLVVEVTSYVR